MLGSAATIGFAVSLKVAAGDSTEVKIYVGPVPGAGTTKRAYVAAVGEGVDLSRKLGHLLSGRGISTTVFDVDEPEEERVGRIASRGGGVYIGVACVHAPAVGIRIRYPRMPPDVHRHRQGPIRDPGPVVRELIAAERAKAGAKLARLMSEKFHTRLGVPAPKLEPSVGDYGLDNTAGTAVIVELAAGTFPGSSNFCLDDSAATAMAEAVEAFLAPPKGR